MAVKLTGSWTNSYGSKMDMVESDGTITGVYSSTTGSSGSYYLYGTCGTQAPTSDQGQNLVISILWRPYDGGTPDNSWHWVSTLCGQLQADGIMTLINSLVATTEFESYSLGNYIDKLTYNKLTDTPALLANTQESLIVQSKGKTTETQSGLAGQWVDMNDSGTTLEIETDVSDTVAGLTTATLTLNGESIVMRGFSDPDADQDALQSLTLCGFMSNEGVALSLSGQWNKSLDQLTLYGWKAMSTAPSDSYMQANMSGFVFIRNLSSKH